MGKFSRKVTPCLNPFIIETYDYIRHEAVLTFLRENDRENAPWVAIYDIAELYEPVSPVVVTNSYHGFDRESAEILDRYLATFSEKITDDNTIGQ
ncbi:MAG: hypothetical protein QNJ68_13990 [Microcoleaceae cyanobacterium MO_207.B10]|nr:hypothetical protein [Microcoleaceae cyanobacterium MO_207.B10]